jgi:tryptophan synthase beta chain
MMVRDFQRVIGKETRRQILAREKRLPDLLLACVGGGSNSIGLFYDFLNDENVRMVGVEAGGLGIETGKHAARFATGTVGVLHGTYTQILQNAEGQILPTHSVSAGLDYPSVGPEHSRLRDLGRVHYVSVTDAEALDAFQRLAELEGILPALEPAHAVAWAIKVVPKMKKDGIVIICMSGRGDKDVQQALKFIGRGDSAEKPAAGDV